METVKCNLCGSDDYRVVYSMPDARYFVDEWFNVVECNHCGLGFVNPRPTRAEMLKYYPSSFYDYFDDERDYHLNRYAAEARFLSKLSSDNKNLLLDVGCANGDFPRFMRQLGWEVEGIEVSKNSKAIVDFKVYREEFTDIPVSEPRYDAITAWAVLEHVHDPMAYFRKAAQVLKKGGILALLVTNFKSLSSRALFREDVPRHLYFFTERTIERYLAESGFNLIEVDYSNKIYSMRPVNFLRYYVYRCLKRKGLEWRDMQFAKPHLLKGHKVQDLLVENVKFVISNPFYVVDRLLMPIYEKYQVISKSYGIVTYIARR